MIPLIVLSMFPLINLNLLFLDLPSTCTVGWPIINRKGSDVNAKTVVVIGQPIKCDGFISKWQYQVKTSKPFRAIIWRPVPKYNNRFKVVGMNNIPAGIVTLGYMIDKFTRKKDSCILRDIENENSSHRSSNPR